MNETISRAATVKTTVSTRVRMSSLRLLFAVGLTFLLAVQPLFAGPHCVDSGVLLIVGRIALRRTYRSMGKLGQNVCSFGDLVADAVPEHLRQI